LALLRLRTLLASSTQKDPEGWAAAGEAVVITRSGKSIAEQVPRCSVRDQLPQLAALREALPEQRTSGTEIMRVLREEAAADLA